MARQRSGPFGFRPEEKEPTEVQIDDDDIVEWEDNWLSNAMAWTSETFLSSWCSTPEHWSSRFANYLWTSCPCCLIFRGVTMGFLLATIIFTVLIAVYLYI